MSVRKTGSSEESFQEYLIVSFAFYHSAYHLSVGLLAKSLLESLKGFHICTVFELFLVDWLNAFVGFEGRRTGEFIIEESHFLDDQSEKS